MRERNYHEQGFHKTYDARGSDHTRRACIFHLYVSALAAARIGHLLHYRRSHQASFSEGKECDGTRGGGGQTRSAETGTDREGCSQPRVFRHTHSHYGDGFIRVPRSEMGLGEAERKKADRGRRRGLHTSQRCGRIPTR